MALLLALPRGAFDDVIDSQDHLSSFCGRQQDLLLDLQSRAVTCRSADVPKDRLLD